MKSISARKNAGLQGSAATLVIIIIGVLFVGAGLGIAVGFALFNKKADLKSQESVLNQKEAENRSLKMDIQSLRADREYRTTFQETVKLGASAEDPTVRVVTSLHARKGDRIKWEWAFVNAATRGNPDKLAFVIKTPAGTNEAGTTAESTLRYQDSGEYGVRADGIYKVVIVNQNINDAITVRYSVSVSYKGQ